MRKLFASLAVLLAVSACSAKHPDPQATLAPLLIDDKGITMPLEQAITHIGFRPYLPTRNYLRLAVIPPLGGDDTNANRGFAVEYTRGSDSFLLSEWPRKNFDLAFGRFDPTLHPCQAFRYTSGGFVWATPRAEAMTLQAERGVLGSHVEAEAHRLLTTGACR